MAAAVAARAGTKKVRNARATHGPVADSVAPQSADVCAVTMVHPDKVAAARAQAPGPAQSAEVAAMFRLLGDPSRTRILFALREAGELCVCDIAASVDASETSVSQALRLLRTAKVVVGRRSGRMVFYSLADGHVRELLELSRAHAAHQIAGT